MRNSMRWRGLSERIEAFLSLAWGGSGPVTSRWREVEQSRGRMRGRRRLLMMTVLLLIFSTACSSTPAVTRFSEMSREEVFSVSMTDDPYVFQPATVTVPAGATVIWTNDGSDPHTVTADPNSAVKAGDVALPSGAVAWDSGPLSSGQMYSRVLSVPGMYNYVCTIHETRGMVGTIVVR
jgi:plastocyanin